MPPSVNSRIICFHERSESLLPTVENITSGFNNALNGKILVDRLSSCKYVWVNEKRPPTRKRNLASFCHTKPIIIQVGILKHLLKCSLKNALLMYIFT